MINKLIISILSLILVTGFSFMGCSKDDSSSDSGVPTAENVTLDQLQSSFSSPEGTGTLPSNKTETMEAVGNIIEIEEGADDKVEDVIDSDKTNLKKNLKSCAASISIALKKAIDSKATDSDSGSWDEEGTINLASIPNSGFDAGTVEYDTSGSFSWSEEVNESQGLSTWTDQDSFQEFLKLKFTNVKPTGVDVTMNGFTNQNGKENFSSSGSYDDINEVLTSLRFTGSMYFSYRSGYAISGSVYAGYFILSCDLTASINKTFTEAELATVDPEDDDAIDDLIDSSFSVSGSMTATFYNAAGEVVHSETLTAQEVWNMD